MIQKPNIKFTDVDTISMKDTSPISPFSGQKISSKSRQSGQYVGSFHITCHYNRTLGATINFLVNM